MFTILIVEDMQKKSNRIKEAISSQLDDQTKLLFAQDINSAKRVLREYNIDLMILDICIPRSFGEKLIKDGGIQLLNEIKKSRATLYTYPKFVVSISEYHDCTETFSSNEDGAMHAKIYYDDSTDKWERALCLDIQSAKKIAQSLVPHRIYDYDIVVVCALKEELDCVLDTMEDVKQIDTLYDDDVYYEGKYNLEDTSIRIVATYAARIGMVASAILTTKAINHFIPRYVVMTGITGGINQEKTGYGDIIVAEKAWDYQAGKEKKIDNERFHQNTIDQKSIEETLNGYARRIKDDIDLLKSIKDSFVDGKKPENELKLNIGPIVSGASVVTNPDIVNDVINSQSRDVLGIEMEIYGFYYAASVALNPKPKYIAIKSVSDFADSNKGDEYHKYAAYTSAKVFEEMAKKYFRYKDL